MVKVMRVNKEQKRRYLGFRVTEGQHARVSSSAEQQGVSPGECCRAIVLEAMREKDQPVVPFEQTLLEEFAALRSIISSVMFDLATQSTLTTERMNQIISHAEQSKIERASHIIGQLLKRQG